MNIFEPIAYDNEEYFDLVNEYITNDSLRINLENKIKQKKKLLFEEQESIREWADTIIDVVKPFVRLDHPHITYG